MIIFDATISETYVEYMRRQICGDNMRIAAYSDTTVAVDKLTLPRPENGH